MTSATQEFSNKKINFPPSVSVPSQTDVVECQASIVIVGANGAGKSRLGAWLELNGPQKHLVHRIAAQRSLVFPDSSSPVGLRSALDTFHFAPRPPNWDDETYEGNKASLRVNARYGSLNNAETAPLNDFDKLLTLLFSENYNNLLTHEETQRKSALLVPIPESLIRKVQALWESVLPNRKLQIRSGEVRAMPTTNTAKDYPARAMSDGERVIFYLSGQCLCAPVDSIIVVDEPEIHLHKAIQNTLWNAIEKARPDCTFIYLTHDLAFAADRTGATKVCLTDHLEGKFSWFTVPSSQDIPEDVYLEVLGSRKPVLFVEGAYGSHDLDIYQMTYPQFTVKPVGGCSAVVSATKVFRSLRSMHHIECFGLVDRDYLEDGQLEAYERAGVFAPQVAEVENLYLIPDLIKCVAHQLLKNDETVLANVKEYVASEFKRAIPSHAMDITRHKVRLGMGRFSSSEVTIEQYSMELQNYLTSINAVTIHNAALAAANDICISGDYEKILCVFNKKDLAKNINRFFDITKSTYIEKVKEMAKRGIGNIPTHFLKFLPDLVAKLETHEAITPLSLQSR
jgi:AAA domain, putative AbiEii toxin, Type IV TA system/Protein of unknown function (DUF4435)